MEKMKRSDIKIADGDYIEYINGVLVDRLEQLKQQSENPSPDFSAYAANKEFVIWTDIKKVFVQMQLYGLSPKDMIEIIKAGRPRRVAEQKRFF